MRLNRSIQLYPDSGTVHAYWRCHNRDFYLNDQPIKNMYFQCIERDLEYRKQKNVQINAFCIMGNHFHMATTYKNGSASLSNFMRYTHGLFDAQYNKTSDRSGSVAEGRPKTPLLQEQYSKFRFQ